MISTEPNFCHFLMASYTFEILIIFFVVTIRNWKSPETTGKIKKAISLDGAKQISFPEIPVGSNQFVVQFWKRARHPDGLLPRLEDLAARQVHRWVVFVGAGQVF